MGDPMIVSDAESLGGVIAMIAVATGIFATFIWAMFASKLTDQKVKTTIIYCMVAILLLTLSEIPYIIDALESGPISPENAEAPEISEYLRYLFITAAYFMLAFAAKTELQVAEEYTFIGSRFKKAEKKKPRYSRKKNQGIAKH
jgi:membrane-associated HD superfamily phosphohydrolase